MQRELEEARRPPPYPTALVMGRKKQEEDALRARIAQLEGEIFDERCRHYGKVMLKWLNQVGGCAEVGKLHCTLRHAPT